MQEKWFLKNTNNLNQMLRVRSDKQLNEVLEEFSSLLIVKHEYHIADDIMFPDPSCLAFFTAFEEIHLQKFEDLGEIFLFAVDIFEGNFRLFIATNDSQKTLYDCISFLKSNDLYKCDFEIILKDYRERLNKII